MKVVLFGAGNVGERVYQRLKDEVEAVIDNDEKKIGQSFHEVPVISLKEYIEKYSDLVILIASMAVGEISRQLDTAGIKNYFIAAEYFDLEDVFTDPDICHGKWPLYLRQLCDKPGYEVLEVGARVVTGDRFRRFFDVANYTGFDYYAGENVDVAGDAHKLSSYFDKKFDLIFSSAVFEHLAMPWQVSLEMIKLLKPGGYVFVETHYSHSSHERPWHFFQFSENALDILFSSKFGMQCVKKGCSNLVEGKFSDKASEYLRGRLVRGLYCHSEYLGRKVLDLPEKELSWDKVSLEDVAGGTQYPNRK